MWLLPGSSLTSSTRSERSAVLTVYACTSDRSSGYVASRLPWPRFPDVEATRTGEAHMLNMLFLKYKESRRTSERERLAVRGQRPGAAQPLARRAEQQARRPVGDHRGRPGGIAWRPERSCAVRSHLIQIERRPDAG